jgi:ABC-type nitrate/sulfonate/bicarbonate transport system substrate-binding protein
VQYIGTRLQLGSRLNDHFGCQLNLSRRHFLRQVTAFSALSVPLAACDSDSGAEDNNPSFSSISLQSPWSNDAEFMGYFIAKSNGYYKDEKLNFTYLPGGPDIIADTVLLSGRCDIALTNLDGTVNAIMKSNAPIKVIGAQYQKSPLGIVSLKENNIREPKDLVGKRLAVPAANIETTRAFLKLNNNDPRDVIIRPYQYDPSPLIAGAWDATVDFVTNVPYSIRLQNREPTSFLFYDHGFRMFMDTIVVTENVLKNKRSALIAFLRASQKGWQTNFQDTTKYPALFKDTWFKDTGRAIDNEIFFNNQQKALIENPVGVFAMSEDAITDNIKSLAAIGLNAHRDMFVPDILGDV